jgi:tetratricopeptide (TPR) repeat protein
VKATFYSQTQNAAKWKLASVALIFAAAGIVFSSEAQNKIFAVRAEAEFHRAQIQFQADTNNAVNAWQLARACYDFADFAKSDKARENITNQGIDACRQLIARDPNIAAAHYYLAMDLGQLARTKLLGALSIVREMEREFLTAVSLDSRFDFAGPPRNLGLLYREAPSFGSIGSRSKARDWLERAVQLAPDYPENRLNLIESYLQWNDSVRAKLELNALDALWSKVQTNFPGEKWEQSRADWSARREAARKELDEFSVTAQSPKNSR